LPLLPTPFFGARTGAVATEEAGSGHTDFQQSDNDEHIFSVMVELLEDIARSTATAEQGVKRSSISNLRVSFFFYSQSAISNWSQRESVEIQFLSPLDVHQEEQLQTAAQSLVPMPRMKDRSMYHIVRRSARRFDPESLRSLLQGGCVSCHCEMAFRSL